jgi:putative transposase
MCHSPVGQWMAMNAVLQRGTSIALACRTFQISETCYRYSPVLSDENKEIADWLERLAENKRTWGFGLCFLYLRNVQGYGWNHKRVYPLADRRLHSNLPRSGSTVNWS